MSAECFFLQFFISIIKTCMISFVLFFIG